MGGMTALWLGIHLIVFIALLWRTQQPKLDEEAWNARADAVEQNGFADLVATTHTRWFSEQFDYQHDALAQQTIQSLANTPALGYANACRALAMQIY
jgi:3-oxoadipate enol-lactonase